MLPAVLHAGQVTLNSRPILVSRLCRGNVDHASSNCINPRCTGNSNWRLLQLLLLGSSSPSFEGGAQLGIQGSLSSSTILRFHYPLGDPDRRISRIRLSSQETRLPAASTGVRGRIEAHFGKVTWQVLSLSPQRSARVASRPLKLESSMVGRLDRASVAGTCPSSGTSRCCVLCARPPDRLVYGELSAEPPLVEKYLIAGKLADGRHDLTHRISNPSPRTIRPASAWARWSSCKRSRVWESRCTSLGQSCRKSPWPTDPSATGGT